MGQAVSLGEYKRSSDVAGKSAFIVALWEIVSLLTLRNHLCVFGGFKRRILILFGSSIGNGVVIKQGVRIKYPWKLKVGDHSWIGEDVWIDNIEKVEISANVCLSQGAYLCTGNHDWSKRDFPLTARPIMIHDGVWVGAKALICPGVHLRARSVIVAGSVVTHDTESNKIYQGNPAACVKDRRIE